MDAAVARLAAAPPAAIAHEHSVDDPGRESCKRGLTASLTRMDGIVIFITMTALKLTAVGTSTGLVIPKEMLTRMRVERGDLLHVVETPEGFLLTPYDPQVAAQVEAGRAFMKQYRDAFKVLAE